MRKLALASLLGLFWLPASAEPIHVAVSILPQKFFAEAIGGEHLRVQVMVRPGFEPATYDPTPRQLAELVPQIAAITSDTGRTAPDVITPIFNSVGLGICRAT